jgi:hypothetical protein
MTPAPQTTQLSGQQAQWAIFQIIFSDLLLFSKKTLWALPDDPHLGPRVHEFYAREIWETLQPEVGRLLKRDRITIRREGTWR